jgi:hypothetical protein
LGYTTYYGKTDADAVFGLLYAQCEDDFKRVELNYIEKIDTGRNQRESVLYNDLEIKLLIDEEEAKQIIKKAAPWLKLLLKLRWASILFANILK